MVNIPIHRQYLSLRFNHHLYDGEAGIQELITMLNNGDDDWKIALGDFLAQWINKSLYIELYTSGSTGRPKKMVLPKAAMVNSALRTLNFFGLEEGKKALLCLSSSYIAGKMMVVRSMVGGLNLISNGVYSNPLSGINEEIDFAAMVPAQAYSALGESKEKFNLIKTIILGGAQVDPALSKKLVNLNVNAWETYGMTETVSHIALRRISANLQEPFELLDGIQAKVDQRSCLVIESSDVNQQALITNDIVELHGDRHFVLKGRYDNVVNSGGIKIIPEEIEAILSEKIKMPFVISSTPHEKWGETLVLVVEGNSVPKFDADIFKGLNKVQMPKKMYYLSSFPRTDSGKVKRKEIKEKLLSLMNSKKA